MGFVGKIAKDIAKPFKEVTGVIKDVAEVAKDIAPLALAPATGGASLAVGTALSGAASAASASSAASAGSTASTSSRSSSSGRQSNSQVTQNPIEIAKIACQAAGISENNVAKVLEKAETIAPKTSNGKTVLTTEAITTAAKMVSKPVAVPPPIMFMA